MWAIHRGIAAASVGSLGKYYSLVAVAVASLHEGIQITVLVPILCKLICKYRFRFAGINEDSNKFHLLKMSSRQTNHTIPNTEVVLMFANTGGLEAGTGAAWGLRGARRLGGPHGGTSRRLCRWQANSS